MRAVFAYRLLLCVALFHLTTAETSFEGPVRAQVVRVIDGDTFDASARIWLGQAIEIRVRIMGIDAPELHAGCDAERQRAEAARDFLAKRIEGSEVKLTSVRYDKYGGRVDASVADEGGDVARAMLKAHMAHSYEGGRRASWCED
jgi:endonuclease YncB( thermonuclease family)